MGDALGETNPSTASATVADGRLASVASEIAVSERRVEILPPVATLAKRRRRRSGIMVPMALAAIVGAGYEGYRYAVEGRFVVSTDDAYVKADTAIIAAKVAGYVSDVKVGDNAVVAKGQVLAQVDDGDYRNAVEAASARIDTQDATIERFGRQVAAGAAAVEQAEANLASQRADAVRDAAEFDRADRLMRSTFGTQQKLDAARADRDRASAAVASAAAAVTSAVAAIDVLKAQKLEAERGRRELVTTLARAERDLAFTTVRAPFDGVVGNKSVQPGQYVQTGGRLLSLVPLGSAYVEANFKETQLARLKPGQPVEISADAYGDRAVEGTIESIAPASGAEFSMLPPENATGNFTKVVQRLPVRVAVPPDVAREGILRPGLSVEVAVLTRDPAAPAPTLSGLVTPVLSGLVGRLRGAAQVFGLAPARSTPERSAER